ncbi:conserved hypothetical protein [Halorhodospira halophila SL1]|uniref:Uncharacterized protein n=2 Tax=Halorhodospira halophila TaxID=1053 RepID=A1WV10_HALHL|nr:conserved hypothetical protein [Halorhodospira halophila SL1]MBK1728771.1 hypothetical protein [Halorhodospira halophila]
MRDLRAEHAGLEEELESLRQRRSNIPARMLELRQRLCQELSLDEEAVPFAGELLQVHEQETDWEGAIERLLHNFGLSLLVPEAHYRAVAGWVDRSHLRGRLVYYRVREPRSSEPPALHPESLVRKIAIRPDSAFYAWLEQELGRRFDYACTRDLETFRREDRAITPAGQIKAGGDRHEKDDRHRIDDRSRFVLGWSNEAKIAALQEDDLPRFEARFKELLNENTIREIANFNAQLNKERAQIRERIATINASLFDIDYNSGRYIELVADTTTDPEVRDFREQLRACTEDTVTGSEDAQYNERKFLQVRAIIERFVASVGFVHGEGGCFSLLRHLSIEAYHAEKAIRRAATSG